jgi:hypothetical protein
MPVSKDCQRITDYERIRRDQNHEASGLRFVQEDRLAGFAVAVSVEDGGVFEGFFLGPETKFFIRSENREFEPSASRRPCSCVSVAHWLLIPIHVSLIRHYWLPNPTKRDIMAAKIARQHGTFVVIVII